MNLEDLSLFNNRISKIDSLDALVKLQVLSLGNNQIGNMMNVSEGAGGRGGRGLSLRPSPCPRKARIPDWMMFTHQPRPREPTCGSVCAPAPVGSFLPCPRTHSADIFWGGAPSAVGPLARAHWGQRPTTAPGHWKGRGVGAGRCPGPGSQSGGGEPCVPRAGLRFRRNTHPLTPAQMSAAGMEVCLQTRDARPANTPCELAAGPGQGPGCHGVTSGSWVTPGQPQPPCRCVTDTAAVRDGGSVPLGGRAEVNT